MCLACNIGHCNMKSLTCASSICPLRRVQPQPTSLVMPELPVQHHLCFSKAAVHGDGD